MGWGDDEYARLRNVEFSACRILVWGSEGQIQQSAGKSLSGTPTGSTSTTLFKHAHALFPLDSLHFHIHIDIINVLIKFSPATTFAVKKYEDK